MPIFKQKFLNCIEKTFNFLGKQIGMNLQLTVLRSRKLRARTSTYRSYKFVPISITCILPDEIDAYGACQMHERLYEIVCYMTLAISINLWNCQCQEGLVLLHPHLCHALEWNETIALDVVVCRATPLSLRSYSPEVSWNVSRPSPGSGKTYFSSTQSDNCRNSPRRCSSIMACSRLMDH